jgi:nitrogen fixation protein FixH
MMRRGHSGLLRPSAGVMLLIAVVLSLYGCGGTSGATLGKTIAQQQQVNQITIAIEAPERAQLLTEQEVLVTLTDPHGQPVEGAQVWLALIMPTMQMSPNEPDAIAERGGRYRAKALFTISGTWQLEVHATIQGQEHIATFHTSTQ